METSSQLGLITIVRKIAGNIENMKCKYRMAFEGLECHNKTTAELIVDDSVEPVAH